jgi:hypothetical protein
LSFKKDQEVEDDKTIDIPAQGAPTSVWCCTIAVHTRWIAYSCEWKKKNEILSVRESFFFIESYPAIFKSKTKSVRKKCDYAIVEIDHAQFSTCILHILG